MNDISAATSQDLFLLPDGCPEPHLLLAFALGWAIMGLPLPIGEFFAAQCAGALTPGFLSVFANRALHDWSK